MGAGEFNAEGNPAMDHGSHPGGSINIPNHLKATETGISTGTDGPLGSHADFTLDKIIDSVFIF